MDRKSIILQHCNIKGKGLEIDPSWNPIAPKKEGYDIETIDHLDKAGLIKKYNLQEHEINRLEDVDYVYNGGGYADLVGKRDFYDYIVASHVIEHVTDIIGFFNDCFDLLKENGTLSLAVPDKNYNYDFFRTISSISKVIDTHLNGHTIHSPGTVCDQYINSCKMDNEIVWGSLNTGEFSLVHTSDEVKDTYEKALHSNDYIDVHGWVFTKSSFELLIYNLNCLGMTKMRIISISNIQDGGEFYATLQKASGDFVPDDSKRLTLTVNTLSEQIEKDNKIAELKQSLDEKELITAQLQNAPS